MLAFAYSAANSAKLEQIFQTTVKFTSDRLIVMTEEMTEAELEAKIAASGLEVLSRIRVL